VGNAEDQILNEIYIMKATKCGHLNLIFSVLCITLCEGYTRHLGTRVLSGMLTSWYSAFICCKNGL